MTEKELRKLKRSDFLQLLLAQGKDMAALQTQLNEALDALEQSRAANERLKAKLAENDTQIEKLRGRLNTKDATINALRQEIADLMASRRIEPEVTPVAPPKQEKQEKKEQKQKSPSSLRSRLAKAIKPLTRPEQAPKDAPKKDSKT